MNAIEAAEDELLLFLKIKGFATDEALAAMLAKSASELDGVRDAAVAQGLVTRREGQMTGSMLSAEGKQRVEEILARQLGDAAGTSAMAATLEKFWPVNDDFKRTCLRWQTREGGEPNDHADADYDATVLADLAKISHRVGDVLADAVAVRPRFARYRERFQAILNRVEAGDHSAFLRPMSESFHDVWMELHEDLLVNAGRTRGADDEG